MIASPESVLDRLRELQREIRKLVVESHTRPRMQAVNRKSAADTIYQIDTLVEPLLDDFCRDWAKTTPLVLIAEGIESSGGPEGVQVFPEGLDPQRAFIRL